MAINTGVDVSKLVGFVVTQPAAGLNLNKLVAYVVLQDTNVSPPVWPAFTFSDGVVSVAYSQDWDLAPASPPTTYTVQSGSLPAGLSVSNVSADIGRLSGTPTTFGAYTFTLRATNAYGTADKSFSMDITVPTGAGLIVHPGMQGGMRG
jgi:hypothetical protein